MLVIYHAIPSIQQQREQRHQLRQQNRARGISESKMPIAMPTSELSLDLEDLDKRSRLRECKIVSHYLFPVFRWISI